MEKKIQLLQWTLVGRGWSCFSNLETHPVLSCNAIEVTIDNLGFHTHKLAGALDATLSGWRGILKNYYTSVVFEALHHCQFKKETHDRSKMVVSNHSFFVLVSGWGWFATDYECVLPGEKIARAQLSATHFIDDAKNFPRNKFSEYDRVHIALKRVQSSIKHHQSFRDSYRMEFPWPKANAMLSMKRNNFKITVTTNTLIE